MKVYSIGTHSQSNTNGKVIICIELLQDYTDMDGIKIYDGNHIINPFYRKLKVNCGKIIKITDLEEETEYKTATIRLGNGYVNVSRHKYFDILNYNFSNDFSYITAYQYKIGILEDSGYIAKGYSGVTWTHYQSGHVKTKSYYKDANLVSRFFYRDDPYNTLSKVNQYRSSEIVECEFLYNEREALINQIWYNSNGKVFHQTSHQRILRPEAKEFTPINTKPPNIPPPPPPAENTSESDNETDDSSNNDDSDQGGLRVKNPSDSTSETSA